MKEGVIKEGESSLSFLAQIWLDPSAPGHEIPFGSPSNECEYDRVQIGSL